MEVSDLGEEETTVNRNMIQWVRIYHRFPQGLQLC